MKEALFYSSSADQIVQCKLCPHHCKIKPEDAGFCRIRENHGGKLYTTMYNNISSINLDPIEKKPLFHFYPGRKILSIGGLGCNFRCRFCQNNNISQCQPSDYFWLKTTTISQLSEQASKIKNNIGLAYTYNEPVIWYELMLDTCQAIRSINLKNVVISNGFISKTPLKKILPYIDAFNIDLKAFNDKFYRTQTQGRLFPVLHAIEEIAQSNAHLEITYLVIPGLNDDEKEFDNMLDWMVTHIGENVPLHLSRYFPSYQMTRQATPEDTLIRLYYQARKKIRYVFLGNLFTADKANTHCPACGYEVISRNRYEINTTGLAGDGSCSFCHFQILKHN